jgi:hypothetical protein
VLCFLEVNARDDEEDGDSDGDQPVIGGNFGFVRYFTSAVPNRFNRLDLKWSVEPNTGLPYIEMDPSLESRYDLVDVSAIQDGLWVQQDFDNKGKYWVLNVDYLNPAY